MTTKARITLGLLFLASAPVAGQQTLDSRELRLEIKEAESRAAQRVDVVAERIEKLEHWQAWWTLLLGAGLGLLGINLAVVAFAYFKACKFAQRVVEAKMREIVTSRSQPLMERMDQYDLDTHLRESSRIVIVAETRDLEGFLRDARCERIETILPADALQAGVDPSATVIIDREHGCSEDSGQELVTKNNLDYVLIYIDGRTEIRSRYLNRANSLVTLFGGLTALLHVRHAVEGQKQRRKDRAAPGAPPNR